MVGRKKKTYSRLLRNVYIKLYPQMNILIGVILIMCPIRGSELIGTNGTRKRKYG
ncbi:MAG: hypothetical protein ACTSO2_18250 [Promethearchaeota archaeon]